MNNEYKALVKAVLTEGVEQEGRNGRQLILPFASFIIRDMEHDHKLTLRKMHYAGVAGEFNTLIDPTPLTNVRQFEANGCNYWKLWAEEDGELNLDYWNELHPTLEKVIKQIKTDPNSRRHVISLWNNENALANPTDLSLHCCWHNLTFSVIENVLHLTWTQRSVDVMVGLPSDVYLAYLFMRYVGLKTNKKIGSCMFALSNVHIYKEHIDGAQEILRRSCLDSEKPLKFKLKG